MSTSLYPSFANLPVLRFDIKEGTKVGDMTRTAMLSYLKALVSAVFLSTVAPGSPVKAPGHFETNTQSLTRGIDVSIAQPSIDWNNVVANQISFAYIKATEGSSKSDRNPPLQSAHIPFQPRARPSSSSTMVHPVSDLFAAHITKPFPIVNRPLALRRPNIFFLKEEPGPTMASLSQVPSFC